MAEPAAGGAELAERLDLAPELRLVPYAFEETYGHPAAGVWRSPGVVTLLSSGDAGLYVPARWGAIVAAEPADGDLIELAWMNRPAERMAIALRDIAPGEPRPWNAAGLAAIWALREAGHPLRGATLLTGVDLPEGTGLAATTATACAIAVALRDLYAPDLSTAELAPLIAGGLRAFGVAADPGRCAAALLGRPGEALLYGEGEPGGFPSGPVGAGPPSDPMAADVPYAPFRTGLPSDPATKGLPPGPGAGGRALASVTEGLPHAPAGIGLPFDPVAAGLRLVVVDTRRRGPVPASVPEYAPLPEAHAGLAPGDPAGPGRPDAHPHDPGLTAHGPAGLGPLYARLRDAGLVAGNPAGLGPLLTAAHAHLRDAGVPDAAQEIVVAAAVEAGALGARMVYDGPGRPAVLLVRDEDLRVVRTSVTGACLARGLPRPRFLTVSPVRGARRIGTPPTNGR